MLLVSMEIAASEIAHYSVLTVNFACPENKSLENNTSRRSAIVSLIGDEDPDIILLQNVNKRRDVEYLDYMLSKQGNHYNYYLKRSRSSVAVFARASMFSIRKISILDLNIIGTLEQKTTIHDNLALVKLTGKECNNSIFVGSWCTPTIKSDVENEKKKRLSSLLVSLLRKEAVGSFWIIGGDFGLIHSENVIQSAQENQGEFYNLVEGTGRIAFADDNDSNYFVFSGMSGHRRLTISQVQSSYCENEKVNSILKCEPLSGVLTITWGSLSPRHGRRIFVSHSLDSD